MTMTVRPRGKHFQYDIHTAGPSGLVSERRNVPDGVTTKKAAERWAAAREQYLIRHGQEEKEDPAPTLEEFSGRWMREYAKAEKLKPSTQAAYQTRLDRQLLPTLGAVRIDRIGEMEIQRAKLAMADLSSKTVRGALALLEEILKAAERWDEIAKAPRISKPTVVQPPMAFFDFDEYACLIAAAQKCGPMELVFVLLAGDAGLRRGELLAFEQADAAARNLTVARNEWQGIVGAPKGGRIRHVPLTVRLREAIAAARHLRGKRLLWQASGRKVQITTLQSWLEKVSRRAGLPATRNVHKLRHTFGAHLAMRSVPAKAIQELMGHADLATTMRYMHLATGSLDAAVAMLEQPAPAGFTGTGAERASPKGQS